MSGKILLKSPKKGDEQKEIQNSDHEKSEEEISRELEQILDFYKSPNLITTTTKDLTQEQIDLLKYLEAEGLIPPITWIESNPDGFDAKMKSALSYMHSPEAVTMGCNIAKGYDYAWIQMAMDSNQMPERYNMYRFMTTPKFVEYIKSLGFTDIAGSKTINKAKACARWHRENNTIVFDGIINTVEFSRRNLIAHKFIELMNEV